MIGYNCKYAPVELLAGFGETGQLINNEAENFDYASAAMHPNMCAHAKAMLEDVHRGDYNQLLFMNCCDSSRRVFDAAKSENLDFCHLMDLPSCSSGCAVEKLAEDLLDFISRYQKWSGKSFDVSAFLAAFDDGDREALSLPKGPYLTLLGARSTKTLRQVIARCFPNIEILDLTCGEYRQVQPISVSPSDSLETIIKKYAAAILAQPPCMRMADIRFRGVMAELEGSIGIVYSTIQFCDYYDFEFSRLKKEGKVPILRIETDCTSQSYGQLLTRLEGFAETINSSETGLGIGTGTGVGTGAGVENRKAEKNMDGIYYIGIDSGSTSTELVALDSNLQVVKAVMVRTGANAAAGGRKALEQAGIQPQQIIRSVATGYGRKNMDFVDENVTEITCHAKGAVHLYPQVRTIIDIGGQDSKVIRLSEDGKVVGFVMNDKCAAGTGRFLENMAKVLELTMDQMATVGLNYQEDLTISNMCTVFAESEVVSLIAENHSVSDIVHGLNKSVASKTRALATSAKEGGPFMMTGGVANNLGVVSELEKQLNASVYIPDRPEFCGALGAALIAAEQAH